jgi:hypothetical protein
MALAVALMPGVDIDEVRFGQMLVLAIISMIALVGRVVFV